MLPDSVVYMYIGTIVTVDFSGDPDPSHPMPPQQTGYGVAPRIYTYICNIICTLVYVCYVPRCEVSVVAPGEKRALGRGRFFMAHPRHHMHKCP